MNSQVYNFYPDPLYVIGTNSNSYQSGNGNFYSITASGLSILGIGTNYLIQLSNPSGTNKTLYLYKFSMSITGTSIGVTMTFIRNGSFAAAGSSVTPVNTNFALTSPSSIAIVKHVSSTPIGSTIVLTTIQTTQIYTENIDSIIAMPPNTTLLIQITSSVALLQTIAINLFWYEF
ncbi:hypothetical protein [Clostridium sp.]|uniref:hypothetical protein n=1 Tax=Clostridium sp. TaxID=1506 RepID=UPI001DF39547|nr:hypothetical protein [Clostridium sp.]MBS5937493.1 hypothetical protein [Clostridium sp.]